MDFIKRILCSLGLHRYKRYDCFAVGKEQTKAYWYEECKWCGKVRK